MTYLGVGTGMPVMILRAAVLAMVLWGSLQTVTTVFDAADASMGLMATINLIAIVLLSGTVAKLTRDYFEQKRAGRQPTFDASKYPELKGQIEADIWSQKS